MEGEIKETKYKNYRIKILKVYKLYIIDKNGEYINLDYYNNENSNFSDRHITLIYCNEKKAEAEAKRIIDNVDN
jgi:hypothetical protein